MYRPAPVRRLRALGLSASCVIAFIPIARLVPFTPDFELPSVATRLCTCRLPLPPCRWRSVHVRSQPDNVSKCSILSDGLVNSLCSRPTAVLDCPSLLAYGHGWLLPASLLAQFSLIPCPSYPCHAAPAALTHPYLPCWLRSAASPLYKESACG